MKLIHCADLHLDSRMSTHLSEEMARERRQELVGTWLRLLEYAVQHQVEAILIAGDLFDTPVVSRTTGHAVLESIAAHPDITFFYLKGNHDTDSFLNQADTKPANLCTFQDTWRQYRLRDHIVIAGREFGSSGVLNAMAAGNLRLQEEDINLVLLHGQVNASRAAEEASAEQIHLPAYAHQGIDYLALGHVHQYQEGMLDGRGIWCYPGCLEGRGFDECTRHGFVLLDIDEQAHQIRRQLVDISARHLWTIRLDVSGSTSSMAALPRIRAALSLLSGMPTADSGAAGLSDEEVQAILSAGAGVRMRPQDLVKLVLSGELSMEAEFNADFLETQLSPMFYYLRTVDETHRRADPQAYRFDKSLKGAFVRSLEQDETLDEDMRARVMEAGLRLLRGESIEGCRCGTGSGDMARHDAAFAAGDGRRIVQNEINQL